MHKNNKPKLLYFLTLGISVPAFGFSLVSCNKKETYLDISKISRNYLSRLNISQLANFHNQYKIFYFKKHNKRIYYENASVINGNMYLTYKNKNVTYKPDFTLSNFWKQELNNFNTYYIANTDIKSSANVNDALVEHSFDSVDLANGFNDEWLLQLIEKNNKDYIKGDNTYFEDMQTVIFKVINDFKSNYYLLNTRRKVNANDKNVLKNIMWNPEYIQASTWLQDEYKDQREEFKNNLILYLNKFNYGIKDLILDWTLEEKLSLTGESSYVPFKIKDIINFEGKSIMDKNKSNITYYINGFRNYKSTKKFGVGYQGLEEEYPLFNEYIPNPLLEINGGKYMNIIDNINEFIKGGAASFEYWSTKGIMYLFNYLVNKNVFSVNIPENKKDEDLKYRIVRFDFTNYLGTNQLFKAIVEVIKKDGTKKNYVWISSNFDDHGHKMKGQILKNVYGKDLESDTANFYNYKDGISPIPNGIKLTDFFNTKIFKTNEVIEQNEINKVYQSVAFYKLLNKAFSKFNDELIYWNNDIRNSYEAGFLNTDSFQIQMLNSFINNYLLSYSLETEAGKVYSGIKRIDIEVLDLPYDFGRVYLKLKFVTFEDTVDYKFKSMGEKTLASVFLYWNGFKGYDYSKDGRTVTIEKIVEGEGN